MTENQQNTPGPDANRITSIDCHRSVGLTNIGGKSGSQLKRKTIIGREDAFPREGKMNQIRTEQGPGLSTSTVIKVTPGYIETKNSLYQSYDLKSSSSSSEVLECKDVKVSFEGLIALEDVTLQLRRGEVVGLIGPNGAGKTTLANVFTGFQRPDRGKISLSGRDITNLPPHRISRMGVSRTFQSSRLFSELNLHQNVEVAAINGGLGRASARDMAGELLDWFGVGEKWHLKANSLTYSDERRVGMARALALRPKFVLLDEPAAGISDAECDDLIRRIRGIPNRFSCGVLLIDHNMRVVMDLCTRVQVLEFGRTIAEGTPAEIQAHPEVLRAYLGTESNQ